MLDNSKKSNNERTIINSLSSNFKETSNMADDESEDDHDSNDDGNDPESKARKRKDRLEQNRISARESRKRKKTMIEELQRTVITLSRDNKELNDRNEALRRELMEIGAKVSEIRSDVVSFEIFFRAGALS